MCSVNYLTIPGTEVQSPSYPSAYPTRQNCQLVIQFTQGERIALEFLAFDLHSDCGDRLVIRDGETENSNLIGQSLCGSQNPSRIVSTGNTLYITFITNSYNAGNTGFRAKVDIGKIV